MVSKSEKKMLYLAGAALAVFLLLGQFGYLAQYGIGPFFSATNQGPIITDNAKEDYYKGIGTYQLSCKAWDSADSTTARTIATNLNVRWYHFTGAWVPETTYDPAVTNYFVGKATDNGYAWIAVECPTAQVFYVDYALIKSSDPYIVGYQYVDVDADQRKEFVFQYDLKNHAVPNSGYPVLSMTSYLMTGDTPTGWTMPANITGIGHALVTKYCDAYVALSTEKQAVGLYKYVVKLNSTDVTKATLKTVMIPGLGTLDGSQFTQSITDSYILWTYTITTNLNGADYVLRTVGSNNKFYFTQQWELLPAATDSLLFTNTLYYLTSVEAGSTILLGNTWMAAGS